jgi:hypothetical protein
MIGPSPPTYGALTFQIFDSGPVNPPYSITPPPGQLWHIHSLAFIFTTSAVAGTRRIYIATPNSTHGLYFQECYGNQVASTTYYYSFWPGSYLKQTTIPIVGLTAVRTAPLSPNMTINAANPLQIICSAPGPGDKISAIDGLYDRFLTP